MHQSTTAAAEAPSVSPGFAPVPLDYRVRQFVDYLFVSTEYSPIIERYVKARV